MAHNTSPLFLIRNITIEDDLDNEESSDYGNFVIVDLPDSSHPVAKQSPESLHRRRPASSPALALETIDERSATSSSSSALFVTQKQPAEDQKDQQRDRTMLISGHTGYNDFDVLMYDCLMFGTIVACLVHVCRRCGFTMFNL